jgi:hypothetical protein
LLLTPGSDEGSATSPDVDEPPPHAASNTAADAIEYDTAGIVMTNP